MILDDLKVSECFTKPPLAVWGLLKDWDCAQCGSFDQLECTRVPDRVLHFDRAAVLLKVMEELTGAQLIAEALKAQVSVITLKWLYKESI